jgi:molybdate transport system substrate-binding protein
MCKLIQVFASAVLVAFGNHADAQDKQPITVFAAASLTDALNEVNAAYTKAKGAEVRASFAASSALARQIEAGARADVFFSADVEWIEYLQQRQLLEPATRKNVLGNRLVLIAPLDSKAALNIRANFPLAATIGKSRLATGDPDSVPVGRYAKSALMYLGVWDSVQDRVVRAENVRVALAYVARGEAAFGIVYETDALIEKKVRVVDAFPANTHAPIVYPLALLKTASPAARDYAAFVAGKESAAIFSKYGFSSVR